ncbi:MAG: phage tail protein [Brevundimonas sp.]|uniref:phage tail sheath subtilisin-like domain-containing protein n=1 Tax=Brevundimonas sp. TaxID=1871086 RepID=UPI000DB22C44|nr:phage tail sheath subtilisin-like domain-containing protein [Brevundimonas sp.]PZU74153.1 MAG: phage tail protein [Brevundimonas sp.]
MALTPRPHGVRIVEAAAGVLTLTVAATSIWGVVIQSSDAKAATFPLNEPVLVSDLPAAIDDAGVAGTGEITLRAIADFGRSIGVVVRVGEGVGETAADKLADRNAKVIAGLQQLQYAEQLLGVKPRIVAAPGLDTQAVAVALGQTAVALNGFAYAASIGATPAEIKTYRDGFGVRELMLIDRDWKALNGAGAEVISYAAGRAVGLRAWLDREVGYHKTISNVAVPGVVGIDQPRAWDFQNAQTEMGLINGADVTGLIRRNGYRYWGNRTCASDPRFAYESAVRTNQVLRDTIADGVFPYIDQPLTAQLAADIIESINAMFRREKLAGRIVGAVAFLAPGNTADQLAAGKLKIGYRFTACAPLEDLEAASEITDEFYADTFNLAA